MIGLDSNVLVRLLTNDDRSQAAAALALMSRDPHEPLVISALVLAEVAWVLRRYAYDRKENGSALAYLIRIERLFIFEREAVVQAVFRFTDELSHADFADYLIQALNAAAGSDTTFTFDADAALEHGFAPVPVLA